MRIALASPRIATDFEPALDTAERLIAEAAVRRASIVCFPEAWIPGLRGFDFDVLPWDEVRQRRTLEFVAQAAKRHSIAVIFGFERLTSAGRLIASAVFDASGAYLGEQAKCQVDPSEDRNYAPGNGRRLFEIDELKFGIAICHEGWRYPETVRWAAVRGAHIVFHPQLTGADDNGVTLTEWGARGAPYYEQAMRMRSIENAIYFASVNYALRFPESATSVIGPNGECEAWLPYGEEGVLVHEVDPAKATGHLARRYAPDRYGEINDVDTGGLQ
jgi:predicted amidohydrolase